MSFGGAGTMSAAHPGYASVAMSNPSGLDLADFPALGSQGPQHTSASGTNSGHMFSSYASQVGTGVSNSAMMMSRGGGGTASGTSTDAPVPFSQEEFPTLNRAHTTQDSRSAQSGNVSLGTDHGTPWHADQHQQQPPQPQSRQTFAQELRKQTIHTPTSPAPAAGPANPSARAPNMWVQPPQGTQLRNAMSRADLARMSHEAALRADNSGASVEGAPSLDIPALTSSHDTVQQQQQHHHHRPAAMYGAGGEVVHLPVQQVLTSPVDRFGLVGLVNLIKTQDPDMAMLSMGSNLQALGMNLDATDPLSASFVTPWTQDPIVASSQVEPAYQLPSCYHVQPPPAQTKVASFSDETLFFIFYSTPRDALQEMAAQELYARNWRYHKGLHLWLTKDPNTEPLQKTPTYERGAYVFFDPGSWDKVSKNFVLMYEMLEEKPTSQSMLAAASAIHAGAPSQLPTTAGGKSSHPSQSVAVTRGSSLSPPNQASPQPSYS